MTHEAMLLLAGGHAAASFACGVFREYVSNLTQQTFCTSVLRAYSTRRILMWCWAQPVSDS